MRRYIALPLSFAAALVAFALLRGPEPAAPATAPAATARVAGDTDAEIVRLQDASRAAPRAVAPRVALATAYLQKARETGDPSFYGRADELLRAALARRPGDHDALVESASLALSRHDFRAALRLARRARAARPAGLAAYPVLVDALVELGRFRAAERRLQQFVNAKPALAGYARVSYLRELHGDLDGAVAAMRRAAAAGGPARESTASVHSLLGGLELQRGRFGAARAAYRAALASVPGYPAAEAGLARLAAAVGDLGGAIRRWRALVERLPLPEYVTALGEAELAAGRDRAGRRDLALIGAQRRLARDAVDAAPAGAQPRPASDADEEAAAGAEPRSASGADEEAATGAEPRPGSGGVDVDAELAVFEADHGSRSRAVALARRAWRSAPGLRAADALGWALTRAGRPDDGLRWARRALALGSVDPVFRYHAGIAALDAGFERAGRRDLRVALDQGLAGWPWQAAAARRALQGSGR